jgi:hypothetical protein
VIAAPAPGCLVRNAGMAPSFRPFVTADGWVRFAFDPPIGVEMGSDYSIEWIGTGAWWACSDANPYGRGFAFNCGGGILPERDFNFRTYAPAQWVGASGRRGCCPAGAALRSAAAPRAASRAAAHGRKTPRAPAA